MSIVSYNGITLPYAAMTSVKQDVVTDDSNTDRIRIKFDVQTTCVINASYLPAMLGPNVNLPTTNPADVMTYIRSRLMQHRKRLSLTFNGVELIPFTTFPGLPGTVDGNNGPHPLYCNITQLTNTTFLLSYQIVAEYPEFDSIGITKGSQAANPVLYNRWTETVAMDNCQYSTYTRQGKFVISSFANPQGIVDMFREQMAVVSVLSGMLRDSTSYTVSPDGLALEYTIVDKEIYKQLPVGAYEAEGEYTESSPQSRGPQREAEVRVILKGPKWVSQQLLINAAMTIAIVKCRRAVNVLAPAPNGAPAPRGLQESAAIRIGMYSNRVEAHMRCLFQATRFIRWLDPAVTNFLGFTPLSDDFGADPQYFSRGNASLLLKAAAYYDSSLAGVTIDPIPGQWTQGTPPGFGALGENISPATPASNIPIPTSVG